MVSTTISNTSTLSLLDMPQGKADWPSIEYLVTLHSEKSRRTMLSVLNNIARMFGKEDHWSLHWLSLTNTQLNVIIGILQHQGRAPTTINMYINAVRGIFNTAFHNRRIETNDIQWIKSFKRYKGKRENTRPRLSLSDVKQLLATCDDSIQGVRDRAIITLLANCGLRREELVSLTMNRLHLTPATHAPYPYMVVLGKGNKERKLPLLPTTLAPLTTWIERYRGNQPGYVFVALRNKSYVEAESYNASLTTQAIYKLIRGKCMQALGQQHSPHALRRYCGTALLRGGKDIVKVRDYLGHALVSTTELYIETDFDDLVDTASLLDNAF